jgi:hypothetical protein
MSLSLSNLRVSAVFVVATGVAALNGGCGKDKPGADGGGGAGGGGDAAVGPARVSIAGTAAPHPLNGALGASEDFSLLKVAIVNPSAVLVDPTAPPLASMTVDTSTGNCDATAGCAFKFTSVDISDVTLGLVGTLEDLRTGDARLWVKTGTGMGTAAFVTEEKRTRAPITGRPAFAVSRKLEEKLAAYVGAVLGTPLVKGQLEARGFLIGHVVGKLSEGPQPAGVAGAKVMATGNFEVIYPTATFDPTAGKGTVTSATGIFLMVPKAAESVVTSWTVVPPAGDSRTWEMHLAGSNPGNAFIIIMPANE